jgi:hypothetical protein
MRPLFLKACVLHGTRRMLMHHSIEPSNAIGGHMAGVVVVAAKGPRFLAKTVAVNQFAGPRIVVNIVRQQSLGILSLSTR